MRRMDLKYPQVIGPLHSSKTKWGGCIGFVKRGMIKYGPTGGFTPQRLGHRLKGGVEQVLCEAANGSLARATWSKYQSCWSQVQKALGGKGIELKFPIDQEMLWTIVACLIERKLKATTIDGYVASLKQAHVVRGFGTTIFDDPFVKAVSKGLKNKEALEPKREKVVVTAEMMRRWREIIKKRDCCYEDRRMIWMAVLWLFCGSFRPSELLAEGEERGGDVGSKMIRWKDVQKLEEKREQGREEVVQIKLRAPKTIRSMPNQVVALPAISSTMCPVLAWKGFIKARGGRGEDDDPVFRWQNGGPFNTRELGRMMWGWSRIGERVTPRDLRAAMPTLLARRGVKEETLKMLGRWKSNAFNSYIRKGRENDWGEAKNALQMVLN